MTVVGSVVSRCAASSDKDMTQLKCPVSACSTRAYGPATHAPRPCTTPAGAVDALVVDEDPTPFTAITEYHQTGRILRSRSTLLWPLNRPSDGPNGPRLSQCLPRAC